MCKDIMFFDVDCMNGEIQSAGSGAAGGEKQFLWMLGSQSVTLVTVLC